MTSLINENFTTYFGNAVLGFYITWSTDAPTSFDITTAKLKMNVTWNLYSAGLSTEAGALADDDAAITGRQV